MNGRRSRGGANLKRPRNVRQEHPRILIVTEGELTEPQYFRGLSKTLRATGIDIYKVSITGLGRDPGRVVKEAAERSGRGERRNVSEDSYEHVWCVVDVDDHATLDSAIRRARKASIDVAVSNPCFEIWLLWHYDNHSSYITTTGLRRKLRQYGILDKSLPVNFPYTSYATAASRALKCLDDDGPIPGENPSSSVCRLVILLGNMTPKRR